MILIGTVPQDLKDTTNAITAASVFMAGLIATGSYVLADLNKFKQLITFSLGSDAESIVYKICAILFMILLLFLTASIYFWYSFSARSLQFNGQQQQSDFARFIQDNKIPKGFTDNFNAFLLEGFA